MNLRFPMRDANFCIIAGGSNRFVNFIHYTNSFSVYSYDIVKLNKYGCRSFTVFPNAVQDFVIYGEKIYSPCSGKIISVKKDVPDNIPSEINLKEKSGNYVIIQNENRFIMLAHLKTNSIRLNQNDSVATGDYIGETGNSGNSVEPHLHLEVHEQKSSHAYPVSIMFDNEFYTYNDIIRR